jgi:hypothetical protein
MRPFIAVLRLELGRWKNLLVVAALGGFMPLLAYTAPGIPDHLRGEICDGAAVIGAVSLALVTVVSAGFGRLGDPTQRAFLLRRGVPGWAVWSGPALAVWAAAMGAIVLAMLPATILGRGLAAPVLGELMLWVGEVSLDGPLRWLLNVDGDPTTRVMPDLSESAWQGWSTVWPLLVLAATLATLQQMASFLGTAMRDRSLRLVPDLLGLPAVGLSFAWATTRLLEHHAVAEWLLGLGILASFTLLAGLVGAGLSTHIGRSDPARSHTGWSLGLWSTLLLGVGALGLRAHWALDVGIEDLERLEHVQVAPAGPWAWVQGPARGRLDLDAKVLVNLESGRSLALGTTPYGHEFSPNGEQAAWMVHEIGRDRVTLWALDLTDPDSEPRVVASGLSWAGGHSPWIQALADDGRVAAIGRDDRLVIIDMSDGSALAMEPPNRGDELWPRMVALEDDGRATLYGHIMEGGRHDKKRVGLEVAALSWRDGSFELRGRHRLGADLLMHYLRMDARRERALVLQKAPHRAWLLDARTAEPIREITLPDLAPRDFLFLADGGFVVAAGQEPSEDGYVGDRVATIQRFDRDGQLVGAAFTYAPGAYKVIGGQPSADTIVLCGNEPNQSPWQGMRRRGYRCHLAELDTGETTPLGSELWPLGYLTVLSSSDGTPPAVGAPATRLFLDQDDNLLWLDLETHTLVPTKVPLGP